MSQLTTYEKYLLRTPAPSAAKHLLDCVKSNAPNALYILKKYKLNNISDQEQAYKLIQLMHMDRANKETVEITKELAKDLLDVLTLCKIGSRENELMIELMRQIGMMAK